VREGHKEAGGSKLTLSVYLPRNCFESLNVPPALGRWNGASPCSREPEPHTGGLIMAIIMLQGISMTREDPWSNPGTQDSRRACIQHCMFAYSVVLASVSSCTPRQKLQAQKYPSWPDISKRTRGEWTYSGGRSHGDVDTFCKIQGYRDTPHHVIYLSTTWALARPSDIISIIKYMCESRVKDINVAIDIVAVDTVPTNALL
jgi:hypothetical protein